MDYKSQAKKANPFDGLTSEERKKLIVYLCYISQPVLTVEDIERKWSVHMKDEERLTVFESLEMAARIKKEIEEGVNHRKCNEKMGEVRSGFKSSESNISLISIFGGAVLIPLLISLIVICGNEQQQRCDNEQQQRKEREVILKNYSCLTGSAKRFNEQFRYDLNEWQKIAKKTLQEVQVSPDRLLSLGSDLRQILSKYKSSIEMYSDEQAVKELLLGCYKKASSFGSPEADYRIALLYVPKSYIGDQIVVIAADKDLCMKYLDAAANKGHYDAMKMSVEILKDERWKKIYIKRQIDNSGFNNLLCPQCKTSQGSHFSWCEIGEEIRSSKNSFILMDKKIEEPIRDEHLLSDKITKYRKLLANHANATNDDIYEYACWMKNFTEEHIVYLKRAAKNGHSQARKELVRKGISLYE